jgi:hypothetical protein
VSTHEAAFSPVAKKGGKRQRKATQVFMLEPSKDYCSVEQGKSISGDTMMCGNQE